MAGLDLLPSGLFVAAILLSLAADSRLRRVDGRCWREGCLTAACAAVMFFACAAVIR